jgi:hypothetical protein
VAQRHRLAQREVADGAAVVVVEVGAADAAVGDGHAHLVGRQRPLADVEDGHQITTACHLANISYRLGGRSLQWDTSKETIVGDKEAAAMMRRPYRKPWDRVLDELKLT